MPKANRLLDSSERELWKAPRLVKGFGDARQAVPSQVWQKIEDECPCCDDDEAESRFIPHRCELIQFEFGPRWTFVLLDHKRPEQTNKSAKLIHDLSQEKDAAKRAIIEKNLSVLAQTAGITDKVVVDCYYESVYLETAEFASIVEGQKGWLSPFCQAENYMLVKMGAPVPDYYQPKGN